MPPAGIEPAHAVWEASGQRISQLAQLAEELNRLGVVLRSATEPFDTSAAAGYRRNEQKEVIPDERTAPTVKRIFELYTSGRLGTAAIWRQLADEQAPAPPAGWQPAVVHPTGRHVARRGVV